MTGKSEHHNDKTGQNSSADDIENIVDLPLGTNKQDLKDAADAILKSGLKSDLKSGIGTETQSDDEDAAGDENTDPLVALVNDLKDVHAEKDELRNQLLRSAAEMENLRKRTRKEVMDAREFAISAFARDLLSVTDNLRRAVDAVPQEEAEADTGGLKNLLEGVSMTDRELQTTLEKHKVKKMSPEGEKFDPNFHQAMFEVENKEVPNNSVIEVVQDGYVIGERMLRPAMVGVAKGGPKFEVAPEDEAD